MNKGVEMASTTCDFQESNINQKKSRLHAATQAALAFFLASCSSITWNKNQEISHEQYQINQEYTQIQTTSLDKKIDTTILQPEIQKTHWYSVEYFYDVNRGWASIYHNGEHYVVSINQYALEAIAQDYNIDERIVENTYLSNEIWSGAFANYFSQKWNKVVNNIEIGELAWDLNMGKQIVADIEKFKNDEYDYAEITDKVDQMKALLVLLKFKQQDINKHDYYGISLESLQNKFSEAFSKKMSVKYLDETISDISYWSTKVQIDVLKKLEKMYTSVESDLSKQLSWYVNEEQIKDYLALNPNTFMKNTTDLNNQNLIAKN